MLGIIIGVGAVIIIMAVGAGAQNLILDQVKSLSTNIIGVLPGGSDKEGPPASMMGIIITLILAVVSKDICLLRYSLFTELLSDPESVSVSVSVSSTL